MIRLVLTEGDGAAAMLTEGNEVRAAVLQACVDRVPRSRAFPSGAIDACFDVAGLRPKDVVEVLVVGVLSPPPIRGVPKLARFRDPLLRRFPLAVARTRLAPLGLPDRIELLPEDSSALWFEGIASPRVAGGAASVGVRGAAPGAWGPQFKEIQIHRALSTCGLPRRREPASEDGLLGVFDGPLPFGPPGDARTVYDRSPRGLADPLPLSPLDAIDAWRRGACDRLRIGTYWLEPTDRGTARHVGRRAG